MLPVRIVLDFSLVRSMSVQSTVLLLACLISLTAVCGCQQTTAQPSEQSELKDRIVAATGPIESADVDLSSGVGWHTSRGDKNSTGVSTGVLPDQLNEHWQLKIKNSAFESTPIIVAGKTADGPDRVYIGDADKFFYAINLETGAVDWQFETEFGFVASAAYSDGKLFVGDVDGKFYCLSEEGEKLWEFNATGQIDSSANFHGDLVLFGSRDAKLYALNRNTGEKAWELETADEVRCGITVVDGRAFVAGCDASVHIIDLDTGKEESAVEIDSQSGTTPSAVGNLVFTGSEQAGIFGIDFKQAKIAWNFNDDEGAISTRSSTAVSGDHVVFGTSHRVVYSVNPKTGKKNWATELKSAIETSPIIVGQHVYVGSNDGRLYRLNLSDGKILWKKQLNGGLTGSPAVAFGKLVIATDRGVVYCLGK